MGTNYYRIPQADEMDERKFKLLDKITNLDLSPSNINCEFGESVDYEWDRVNPWQIFVNETNIHLGKRSSGWKFLWNFHKDKYYSNKDELFAFIRSGRIVDEYGEEENVEDFITMALEWGQPDGWVVDREYRKKQRSKGGGSFFDDEKYDDRVIDGLRVCHSTDFS